MEQLTNSKNLVKFNSKDYNSSHELNSYRTVLQEDIIDFTVASNYLFLTKKVILKIK